MPLFLTPSRIKTTGFRVSLGGAVAAVGLFWSSPAFAVPPTITSVSPTPVIYGVTGSRSVTISGTLFVAGATITLQRVPGTGTVDCLVTGTDKCTLSGTTEAGTSGELATAAKPFVFNSSSTLRFWWDNTALAPGTYDVRVTNLIGETATLPGGFTVDAPQPTIAGLNPPSVTYGVDASRAVRISGTNFVSGARINIVGTTLIGPTVPGTIATAATPFVYVNSTTLYVWWPNTALAPGAYEVRVRNPAEAGALLGILPGGFVVVAPQPTIAELNPPSVTYGVDTSQSVRILGTNYVTGATISLQRVTGTVDCLETGTDKCALGGTTEAGTSGELATAAKPFVYNSSGTLRFWWPNTALAPGEYEVRVTNPAPAGGLTANPVGSFTVDAPQPTIAGLNPPSVTYGVDASRAVRISGANFVSGARINLVGSSLIGLTVPGTIATAATPFVYVSSTTLSVWWPNTALAPGAYEVRVRNPAETGGLLGSLPNGFIVSPPQPTIESVQPSTVEFGITPSGSVTITGTNFFEPDTAGLDKPRITVGGFSCDAVSGAPPATPSTPCVHVSRTRLDFYWENTSIRPGVHAVQVTNPVYAGAASGSMSGGFSVTAPQPRIQSVSPAIITAGFSPSRFITIVGTVDSQFIAGATVRVLAGTVVAFTCDAVLATSANPNPPCLYVGPAEIRFFWDTNLSVDPTNPILGPGTYDVRVTNPADRGGLRDTLIGGFEVTAFPKILSVGPVGGIGAGAQGAVVSIVSTGFGPGASVRIGTAGTQDPAITLTSGFRAYATADGGTVTINVDPAAAPGDRDVTLTTPGGYASSCLACLPIKAGPVITSMGPPELGAGAVGQTLVITGSRFAPGATVVLPAGVTGTCSVSDDSTIACSNVAVAASAVPGRDPVTVTVTVTNPDGGRDSGALTVNPPPVVSALSPASGSCCTTMSLTIMGAGFQLGALDAAFGSGLTLTGLTRVSETTLTAQITVTSGAPDGYRALTVTNPDGGRVRVAQAFYIGTPPTDPVSVLASYGQQDLAAVQYQRSSPTPWSNRLAGPSLAAPPVWQVMKANPVRDERILAVVDEQRRLTLHVWNGQAWMGDLQATVSSGRPRPTQTVDVAFEQVTGGKGLAVYALSGSSSLRYRTWDATAMSWSAEDNVTGPIEMMGTPLWVRLETRPTTDEILLVYGDSANAVGAAVWRGATQTWTDQVVLTTIAPGHDAPLFDVAFERATGRALVAWATTDTPTAPHYRIWNSGWGAEATAPSASDAPDKTLTALRLSADPAATSNRIALAASSGTPVGTLATLTWDGAQSQWSSSADIVATRLVMDGGGRAFDLGWEGSSGDQIAVYASRGSSRGVYKTRSSVSGSAWSALPSALPPLPADPQTTLTPPCLVDNTFCVTIAGTTLYVTSTAGFPPAGVVVVDAELIRYTGKTATSLSGLTRGEFGTTATDHASGATVALRSFPAWVELAGVRGLDNLALALFDITGRVTLAQWDGSAWGGALEAQPLGAGFVSSVAGRAVAVTLAQHLAGITSPPPVTDTTSPATPTLAAGTPAVTSVPLSWTAVGDDGMAGGMVSRYELRRTRGTDSTIQMISATQLPGVTETILVTGLQGGTTYTFELRAQDEVPNASGWSAPVTATTPVDQPPVAIPDLREILGTTTPNAISIQWTVPADDSGPLAGYSVRYSTTATPFNFDTAIPYTAHAPQTVGTTATLVLDGLVPGTAYYIGVKAMDAIGQWGALSNVLNARTADAVLTDTNAPAPISDLTVFAAATTSASLLLQWTATGDDGSVGTAGAYEVRYATAPLTTTNFARGTLVAAFPPGPAGSAQELAVSGLSSNTAHYFAIDVVDDGGNHSGLSNLATGRTALRRGYNLVSVPLVLTAPNDTADMVFGDDVGLPVYAYRWKSSGSLATDGCYLGTIAIPGFTVCGPLGSVQTGAGYFLYSSSGTQAVLDALGVPVPDSPYDVPLDLGFNMVGNPYGQEIPLASVQVKRTSTGEIALYADAVTKGWVGPAIYIYDGVTTQLYGPTDAVLKPWNGVWVQSLVPDAMLVFARP